MADRKIELQVSVDGAKVASADFDRLRGGVKSLSQELLNEARAADEVARVQAATLRSVNALSSAEAELKSRLAETQKGFVEAQFSASKLQSSLDATGKRMDSLGIQTALAKRALADLAANGIGKSHVEYQALSGEIRDAEAELKRSQSTLKVQQREYAAAAREVSKLDAEYRHLTASVDQASAELAAQRTNLNNLTAESARLQRQAEATALALKAQANAADTARAWQGIKMGVAAQQQARQDSILAAARQQWSGFGADPSAARSSQAADARAKLGIRGSAEIVSDIRAVKAAYADLAASGQASMRELARAEQTAADKVRALKSELRGSVATPVADARAALGIRGASEIEADITKVKAAYQTLAASGRASGQELSRAQDAARDKVRALRDELSGAAQSQKALNREMGLFGAARNALAGLALLGTAKQGVQAADSWANLSARLKLATTSTEEYGTAQRELFAISQRNFSALESTVDLYTKNAAAMRDLGMTQRQTLDLTDAVAMSMRVSGAGAAQSAAGILQFSQAIGSGVLRGDEFNSMMENSPRLAKALADGLKVPISSLRKMAEQGELTAEKVIPAVLSQMGKLRAESAQMPVTVGGAWQKIENAALAYIGKADQASGSSGKLALELSKVADNFDAVANPIMAVARVEVGGFNRFVGLVRELGDALSKLPKGDFLPDVFRSGLSQDAQAKAYEADIKRMIEKGFGPASQTPAPAAAAAPATAKLATESIMALIADAAKKYQVPEAFALAIAKSESSFNPAALSNKGAMGIMQLTPATAERFGVDAKNVKENIDGGMRYLKLLLGMFHNDLRLAAAAYNAGENTASLKKGMVPNYTETQNYVARVGAAYDQFLAKYPGGLPFAEQASQQKEVDDAFERFKAGIDQMVSASESRARLDAAQGRNEIARIEQERTAALASDQAKIEGATRYADRLKLLEQSKATQIDYYRREAAIQRQQVGDEQTALEARRQGINQQLADAERYKLGLSEINRLKAEQAGVDAALKLLAEDRRGIDLDLAAKEAAAGQAVADAKKREAEYIQGINRELQFQVDLNNQLAAARMRGASNRELAAIKGTAEQSQAAAGSVGAGALPGIQAAIAKTQELKTKNEELAGGVAKVSEAQLRMNAIWDQTLSRQRDYSQTWREITGQQQNAFADLSVSIMEYAKQLDQIGQKYAELSAQDPASKGFYDTQQGLETAQAALNAMAKTALQMRSVYKEGTKGYQEMTNAAGQMAAAAQVLNVVEGISAVIHQLSGGDPYSAIPRALGVAAMVASLGIQTGLSVKAAIEANKITPQAGTSYDKTAQTGTVFGDASAKSDSIASSLEVLKQNSSADLDYSAGMLRALQNIDAAMGGVTNNIIRNVAPVSITQPGKFTNGIGLPAIMDPGMMLTNFLIKRVRTISDWGIEAIPQGILKTLKDGFSGQVYTDIKTETKMFGMTVASSMKTVLTELDQGVANDFTKVIRSVQDSTVKAGESFGLSAADFDRRLRGFVVDFKLSLKGLSGDEITKQVSALFSSMSDRMARRFMPGLAPFEKVGEGYFKTMVRVAEGTNRATTELSALGIAAISYEQIAKESRQGDVAAEIVRQSIVTAELGSSVGKFIDEATGSAEDLISVYENLVSVRNSFLAAGLDTTGISRTMANAAGGVDKLKSSMSTFREKFLTPAEQMTSGWRDMAAQFTSLGLKMPTTRQAYRDLVEGIDATTDAGKALFGHVISLADAFDTLTSSIQESADASYGAIQTAYNNIKSQAQSLRTYLSELKVNDASLSPQDKYQNDRKLFDDTLAKAKAGDADAQGKLTGYAGSLLDASRAWNASSAAYQQDLSYVQGALGDYAGSLEGQMSAAEKQLFALDGNTTAIQELTGTAKSLSTLISDYAKLRANGAAASGETTSADSAIAQAAQPATVQDVGALNAANSDDSAWQARRRAAAESFTGRLDEAQRKLSWAAKQGRRDWRDYWASVVDGIKAEVDASEYNLSADNQHPKGFRRDDLWKVNLRARGGMTEGPTIVGERGPELIDFPSQVNVLSNGSTRSTLAGLEQAIEGQGDILRAGIKTDQEGYRVLARVLASIDARLASVENNSKLARSAA